MRRLLPWLLLALLALPSASAGGPADPQIRDPEDRADWSPTDLLAAWFDAEKNGLRFSIQTLDGSMPEEFPDHAYWVSFRVEGRTVEAMVGFGDDGVMRGHLGALREVLSSRRGFDAVANGQVVGLESERGRPSTWSGLIPWGAVEGLEPDAVLTDLAAGTTFYDREAARWRGNLDVARASESFVAKVPKGFFPILVPAWVIPALVLGCVVAGAVAGVAAARLTRPSPSPPSVPAAPAWQPPPPGERFRRDPRQ